MGVDFHQLADQEVEGGIFPLIFFTLQCKKNVAVQVQPAPRRARYLTTLCVVSNIGLLLLSKVTLTSIYFFDKI